MTLKEMIAKEGIQVVMHYSNGESVKGTIDKTQWGFHFILAEDFHDLRAGWFVPVLSDVTFS